MGSTIVVYYSFEGNTNFVAETIRKHRGVVLERLQVKNEPPKSGLGKFLVGGGSALRRANPELKPLQATLADYPNLILAFPVWAGTYPPAIGAFLKQEDLSGKNVFLIACSASGKGDKAIEAVAERLPGCEIRGTLNLLSPLKNQEETSAKLIAFLNKNGITD